MTCRRFGLQSHFAGVEDALGIQRRFNRAVEVKGNFPNRGVKPGSLGETDAVLSGDASTRLEDPGKEALDETIGGFPDVASPGIFRHHDVGVDVAVTGMSKAGNLDAGFCLHAFAEGDQLDKLGARDDDIFVEFGKSGGFQAVGELSAQLPDGFDFLGCGRLFDVGCTCGPQNAGDGIPFGCDGVLLTIDFNDDVAFGIGWQGIAAKVGSGCGEGEGIGDFHRGREVPALKNVLYGFGRKGKFRKAGTECCLRGRGRDDAQGRLGHDAQHAF